MASAFAQTAFAVGAADLLTRRRGRAVAAPNVRPLFLPPYSPELDRVEHVWDALREKYFHNRFFDSLEAVEDHLEHARHSLERDSQRVRSIIAWPWTITSLPN